MYNFRFKAWLLKMDGEQPISKKVLKRKIKRTEKKRQLKRQQQLQEAEKLEKEFLNGKDDSDDERKLYLFIK